MASPELPRATLRPYSLESIHETDRQRLPRFPTPSATSRGFHNLSTLDKTPKICFLHLPSPIRTWIYELARIYHDRGAVFLPRAIPRKCQPNIDDVGVEFVEWEPDVSGGPDMELVSYRPLRCEPGIFLVLTLLRHSWNDFELYC